MDLFFRIFNLFNENPIMYVFVGLGLLAALRGIKKW